MRNIFIATVIYVTIVLVRFEYSSTVLTLHWTYYIHLFFLLFLSAQSTSIRSRTHVHFNIIVWRFSLSHKVIVWSLLVLREEFFNHRLFDMTRRLILNILIETFVFVKCKLVILYFLVKILKVSLMVFLKFLFKGMTRWLL